MNAAKPSSWSKPAHLYSFRRGSIDTKWSRPYLDPWESSPPRHSAHLYNRRGSSQPHNKFSSSHLPRRLLEERHVSSLGRKVSCRKGDHSALSRVPAKRFPVT